jgi:HlyD family secretion protein
MFCLHSLPRIFLHLELQGQLVYVSPATSREAGTGQTYYVGHVSASQDEFAKIGADRLLPGMPVEVFMSTEERTAMSYLLKPVIDQFSRAMRER